MADVMKFDDFKAEGSEAAVKVRIIWTKMIANLFKLYFTPNYDFQAAGKYRQQGKTYVVEDGDIIFFKFNAGAGLKDNKKKA